MPTLTHRLALRTTLFVLFVMAVGACAAKSSDGTGTTRRSDPSIMDSTELRSNDYSTVYDAISARRANWLLPRGGPTGSRAPELGVWIEGSTQPRGVAFLRNLRPIDIRQVRRLSTTESLHTYSWPWGGLVITLR
jgi:hypothetical protein